ncbi:cell division protein SepF [Ruminococcus sp. CLA-AA-H200]|uniref:Cell division protein SepF n=1 Tax=Ruminococcus turbiniformis TaxID=2881258 RepID=A0ABS8FT13_9FIRM|nr:cell division protein SepF [Ruminococcus turbiniformis]MCC2253173.1 cell division protein SepF [Ruminococcus turbiniformis]
MGVFDKFLDIMKLNDDDYDDEFYDDDEYYDDDYEDKPHRRSLFGKKNSKEDNFDDFEIEEDKKFQPAQSSKVTPMRQPAARKGGNMEVCVVKPTSVDDSREITETLLSGRTVILNLEGMDLEIAQRIIDFISGATFAISGNLQKISNYIFLVTPTNVDISGDLQDLLGNSMETPSVKGRY